MAPWQALTFLSSETRVTKTVLSLTSTLILKGMVRVKVPFGPATVTRRLSTVTVTPVGIVIGCFPILDIVLVDFSNDFTTKRFGFSLFLGHNTTGSGNNN